MKSALAESKQALRLQIKARLREISVPQREESGAKAAELLRRQPLWQTVKSVLFYAPLPTELSLWRLVPEALAAGKTVLLPRYLEISHWYEVVQIKDADKSLSTGKYGIMEPSADCSVFPLNRLDLTLVPGLAFDPQGGRLGRGGGFYDRMLAQVSGVKCGVAFDEQIVPQVPVEPHDVHLNCIMTPTRWLSAGAVAE